MSKIFFKNKKYYFNIFLNKIYFKKQLFSPQTLLLHVTTFKIKNKQTLNYFKFRKRRPWIRLW
jgi:hypothetical protein